MEEVGMASVWAAHSDSVQVKPAFSFTACCEIVVIFVSGSEGKWTGRHSWFHQTADLSAQNNGL